MKTRFIFSILTILMSIISVQSVLAQAEQDALYIFRNDGKFNAFFYGDIDHIEYSKIDTLGVEQADYVVQEVYALDSVFRIPLSAIDSVAFVTPETKFKPGVFCPDKSIGDYIVASDSLYWIRLALNTPKSLIPQVGDKLYIEDESKYIPDGFGGLVDEVIQGSDGYTIMTSALQLTDIFEFLVVKVAAVSDGDESASACKRAIGEGTEISTPEFDLNIPTINHTVTIKNSTGFLPDGLLLDLELNGDIQASLSAKIEFKKFLTRTFLTITPFTGIQFYQYNYIDIDSDESQTISGGFSGRAQLMLWGATKNVKGLKVGLSAGVFLEGSATALEVKHTRKQRKQTRMNVTLNNDDIYPDPVNPLYMLHPYYVYHWVCPNDTSYWELNTTGQYSIGTGVYAKAETSFKVNVEKALNKVPIVSQSAKDKLAEWIKADSLSFKAELGIDMGAKLDFKAPIWTPVAIKTLADLLNTQTTYKALNTDADIKMTAYAKFSAILKYKKWGADYTPAWDAFSTDPLGLVPNISAVNVDYADKKDPIRPYRIRAVSPINRDLLDIVKVGYVVVDNDSGDEIVVDTCDQYYLREATLAKNNYTYNCVMELDPGKDQPRNYTVYPQVELWGKRLLVDQSKQFLLGPAQIDIEKREIYAHTDDAYTYESENEITVIPNMPNMEVRKEADWLREPIWTPHTNTLCIGWKHLENTNERRGIYRLIGKDRKGNVLIEDSIVVIQMSPTLVLKPSQLHFDAKGGTDTVTIVKTNINMETLQVTTTSDFIYLDQDEKKIIVRVDKNQDEHQRSGTIKFEGEAPNGFNYIDYLTVTQDGDEGEMGEIVELLDSIDITFMVNCKELQYREHWEDTNYRLKSSSDFIVRKETDGYSVTGSKDFENGTYTIKFKLSEKKFNGTDWYTFDEITDFEYHEVWTADIDAAPNWQRIRLDFKCEKIPFRDSYKYKPPHVGGYYQWTCPWPNDSESVVFSDVNCEFVEIQQDGTRKIVNDTHISSGADSIDIFAKSH